MENKHLVTLRVLSKKLVAALLMTSAVSTSVRAGGMDAYQQRTDDSSGQLTSSNPVYMPSQWSMSNGEVLRGFIRPANGISVAASANVRWGIFGAVSGQISLGNGSTVNLECDLDLTSSASLAIGGSSIHKATIASPQPVAIHLGGDFSLPASRTLFIDSPELTLDGRGYTLNFANSSAALRINSDKMLTLRNMVINGLSGANQIKGPGTLKLQNCVVNIPTDTTWTTSWGDVRILMADDVVVRGGGKYVFGSATSLTVSANSILSFDTNTTFSFAPQDQSNNRLYMGDSTSILRFDGATFCAPGVGGFTGLQMRKGMLMLDNKVTVSNGYHHTLENAITLGDGTDAGEVDVHLNAGASFNMNCGILHYNNANFGGYG